MLVVSLDYSDYVGRIAHRQDRRRQDPQGPAGRPAEAATASASTTRSCSCWSSTGSAGREVEEVAAGDICAVVGLDDVGHRRHHRRPRQRRRPAADRDRRADAGHGLPHQRLAVRRPGRQAVTSRQLRDRLIKELESNVALRVRPSEERATSSSSPAAACCTWRSCSRTCAARASSWRSASRR